MAITERAIRVFNSTNPLAHALLVRLAPLVLARSAVQDKAAPRLGQIASSYRGRPITKGAGRIGRLRAGDRVPDVHLAEGRLYDLLDPCTVTLFVMADQGRAAPAYCEWSPVPIAVRHIATSPCRPSWAPLPAGCWFGPTGTSRQRVDPETPIDCTDGWNAG